MNKEKKREALLYLLFGALTTLVNFISFYLISLLVGEEYYLITNLAAWLIAVIFAYLTNKLIVFRALATSGRAIIREALEFLGARIFSLALEELGLFLLVDALGMGSIKLGAVSGQMIAKIILAVIVVLLNYLFSKFIIFKKK